LLLLGGVDILLLLLLGRADSCLQLALLLVGTRIKLLAILLLVVFLPLLLGRADITMLFLPVLNLIYAHECPRPCGSGQEGSVRLRC
jgi:hypothetical protein